MIAESLRRCDMCGERCLGPEADAWHWDCPAPHAKVAFVPLAPRFHVPFKQRHIVAVVRGRIHIARPPGVALEITTYAHCGGCAFVLRKVAGEAAFKIACPREKPATEAPPSCEALRQGTKGRPKSMFVPLWRGHGTDADLERGVRAQHAAEQALLDYGLFVEHVGHNGGVELLAPKRRADKGVCFICSLKRSRA
jgi:hypothetical protein